MNGLSGITGTSGVAGMTGYTGSGPLGITDAYYALKKILDSSEELRNLFKEYRVDIYYKNGMFKNYVEENDFINIPDNRLPILIGIHSYIDEIIEKRLHKKEKENVQKKA